MLSAVSRVRSPADSAAISGKAASADRGSSSAKADQAQADVIRKLKARDAEVRAHEQAHAATGGAYAGAPSFEYQRGPDGRNYAVGGEVPIDVSAIPGDPEATIRKLQQVQRAALAPADPSGADRAVAATADAMILAARSEQSSGDSGDKGDAGAAASSPHGAVASPAGDAAREILGALERRSASAGAYDSARFAGSITHVST